MADFVECLEMGNAADVHPSELMCLQREFDMIGSAVRVGRYQAAAKRCGNSRVGYMQDASSDEIHGVSICIYLYTYANMHTYKHKCIHSYMHTCRHAYIHTYIHIYIHTLIHDIHYITWPTRIT